MDDARQTVDATRHEAAEGGASAEPRAPWEEASNVSAACCRGEDLSRAPQEKANEIKRIEARRKRYARRAGLRRAYAREPELGCLRTVEGWLPRWARCGHVCRTGEVEIRVQQTEHGPRGFLAGLESCGSVWVCPVCAARVWARRREDLAAVAQWAGEQGATSWLVSLTLRHRARHDLGAMIRGLAGAWRKFIAGRWWKQFCAATGYVGSVRRLEVTWGRQHGWHPHLHVQFFASRSLSPWIFALQCRWRAIVERTLGRAHRPTLERGCDVRIHDEAHKYIGDSPLELTDHDAKRARHASRLSMAQLAELVSRGAPRDASASARARHARLVRAWGEYAEATRGRRALTWSVGLRKRAGLLDDEEVADAAADAAETEHAPPVATMPGETWSRVRWRPRDVTNLLDFAEKHDVYALIRAGCDAPLGWIDPAESWPRAG